MAPEVLNGGYYDGKADMFSCGVILYQMLYGTFPWIASGITELSKLHKTSPRYDLVDVSPLAIDLLQGLLHIDPLNRLSFDQFFSHTYVTGSAFVDRPLHEMVTISTSARVVYPNNIFDFGNDTPIAIVIKLKKAWIIAETALLMQNYGRYAQGLCLFVRSLRLLRDVLTNEILNPIVETWIKSRYQEFEKRAVELGTKIVHTDEQICAEDVLYDYAIGLAKEAAYTEYLHGTSTACVDMYYRSKLILEYLLDDCNCTRDYEMLQRYINLLER
jgi:hypothetical protein